MANTSPITRYIKFLVAGGGSLSGESGAAIRRDIESIISQLEGGGHTRIRFGVDSAGLSTANAQIAAATRSTTQLNAASRQNVNEVRQLNNAWSSAITLYNRYSSSIQKNTGLSNSFQSLFNDARSGAASAADLQTRLSAIRREILQLGVESDSTKNKLFGVFNTRLRDYMISGLITSMTRAIRNLYNNVINLDKAVVNLSMVTGNSRAQTKALMSTYIDMAREIGSTATEVANSANEWLRQGYTMEETNKLVETSMVLSKVGMLESAEATQYLTSALKGYKIDIEDAMSVVDKMSAVDMAAAVSTAGLAEAVSKTANQARLAGVEMDRLYGYIAAVAEVSQADPSSVGTSFKTMFARMSNIKLGRLEDEEGNDISAELSDAETVLNRIGIQLRSSKNEFRDFSIVLDEVASKWKSMSEVDQSTIAMAFGGTRQKEQVLTLFENYDNALKYSEISAESAGSAMQKFESYTSGVEAATQRFKSTWESISFDLLDSDILAGVIDFGTAILKVVDALAQMKVLLPTIVAGITTFRNFGELMMKSAGLCTLRKCA